MIFYFNLKINSFNLICKCRIKIALITFVLVAMFRSSEDSKDGTNDDNEKANINKWKSNNQVFIYYFHINITL